MKNNLNKPAGDNNFPELLGDLTEKDKELILSVISRLSTGLNKSREIIKNLTETAKRDNIPVQKIISEHLKEILDAEMAGPLKIKKIRFALFCLRYPEINKAYESFFNLLKELNVKNLKITPPDFFETREFKFYFKAKSKKELLKIREEIDSLIGRSDEIFK